jgi:hypothetical protein
MIVFADKLHLETIIVTIFLLLMFTLFNRYENY